MRKLALVLALSLWANVGLSVGNGAGLADEVRKDTKEKPEDTNSRVRGVSPKFNYLMSIIFNSCSFGCLLAEKRVAQRKFKALLDELHKDE